VEQRAGIQNFSEIKGLYFFPKFSFWHESRFYQRGVRFCIAAVLHENGQCIKARQGGSSQKIKFALKW